MNHPILIATLVEDRCPRCTYGAVAQNPHGLCCDCQAALAWRREITRTSLRASPSWTHAGIAKARLFARRMAALVQIIGKGSES